MILTTESQGLPQGPHHIAQMARNAQRIADWRERKSQGQGSAPSRSFIGRAFYLMVDTFALCLLIALPVFWLIVIDALVNVPEPETREFTNHISSETYTRTQRYWSVGDE